MLKQSISYENSENLDERNMSISDIIDLIRHLDDRLTSLENQTFSLKSSLDNSGVLDSSKAKIKNIDKIDNILENISDTSSHIREAKDFLKTMVSEDDKIKFLNNQSANFMKNSSFFLNKSLNPGESSQKFFSELSSEHLLDIFNQNHVAQNNSFLDSFLASIPKSNSVVYNPKSLIEEDTLTRVSEIGLKKPKVSKSKKTKSKKAKPKTSKISSVETKKNRAMQTTLVKKKSKQKIDSAKRQLSRKLVMQHVTEGKEFYFSAGVVVKSIHELYVYLNSSNESIYNEHVTDFKNDFADWINYALGYSRFGNIVRETSSREEFLKLLKDVCE